MTPWTGTAAALQKPLTVDCKLPPDLMPRPQHKAARTRVGSVAKTIIKSVPPEYWTRAGMAGLQFLRKSAPIYRVIHTEIVKAGLKPDKLFYSGLERYTRHYKLKGRKADIVRAYLAKQAIHIAKTTEEIFPEEAEADTVKISDLKGATFFYHLPAYPNDPCVRASSTILSIEEGRPKGEIGMLTPGLSNELDKIK
jgi:hypothetical protein